ncbi:MAG: DUF4956 domain-containing protein [Candidatus Limivivens sp.]|nr:DUF4956 domain-containing protein [Candidatus Limivivens sp.]
MLDSLFTGLYSTASGKITLSGFLISLAAALILGAVVMLVYTYRSTCTKSFAVTLATLPAIVCVVIMMVSGSLGAGVAVAGTFSLVRFRSVPGTAKEISAIFLAMAVGLACGMGYPGFAVLFTVIMCAVNLIYRAIGFEEKQTGLCKNLQITVPEDLEYGGMFDDLFRKYTTEAKLVRVKTTDLGSLNRLTYQITLREENCEKALIDELRCRNGNLEINLSVQGTDNSVL